MKADQNLTILKIGGNVLADPTALDAALTLFAAYPGAAILVHGGGKRANELLLALGHTPQMVNGRRITDAPTLEIAVMVYAGLINKQLVAFLQAKDCPALGISGADANAIQAHKRPVTDIDYGFVGDIDTVNAPTFQALLGAGFRPVCCAITHDGHGQLLNTNADTIASALAHALAPHYRVTLDYCFEKPGVLLDADRDDTVIPHLTPVDYARYKAQGIIHSGMLPKLDNAFAALHAGVHQVRIGHVESLRSGAATRVKI